MVKKAKTKTRRKVFWRLKAEGEKSGPCTLHCFGNIDVESDSFLLLNLHGHYWKIQMSMDDDRNFHCCLNKNKFMVVISSVSYTHLTLPTNREV